MLARPPLRSSCSAAERLPAPPHARFPPPHPPVRAPSPPAGATSGRPVPPRGWRACGWSDSGRSTPTCAALPRVRIPLRRPAEAPRGGPCLAWLQPGPFDVHDDLAPASFLLDLPFAPVRSVSLGRWNINFILNYYARHEKIIKINKKIDEFHIYFL